MPLSLRRGEVTAVLERHDGLARIEVDGLPCIAYPALTGPVALGDAVIVNTQARDLDLGSGGFDVLYANLTRGLELAPEEGAHVMKLPYTPLQFAEPHGEEGSDLPERLDGLPVVCLTLHSQLVPACAALEGRRVAYVQIPGGALPVTLSDAVRALRRRGLLELAVGVGPCFGGDVDCVNLHSALALVRGRGVEAAVCGIGPGIVGTGTRLGHGGMLAAYAIDATLDLGGRPILAPRLSTADERPRHHGVSHHTEAVLSLRGDAVEVAWPAGLELDHPLRDSATEVDVTGWREACAGLPLSYMGRGPDDEAAFFTAAFAAGRLARERG